MEFVLEKSDTETKARAGLLKTVHGNVPSPVFMPVGTQGTVKGISPHELAEAGVKMVLANTYHLVLRPGDDLIRKAGGLHDFMGWAFPILTDSGGYQVFSLSSLRKITDDGVRFQSHIDGSTHVFTPENVMDVQHRFGSDVMMVLDECSPYPCSPDQAENAVRRTLLWAERSIRRHREIEGPGGQALFGIVQGSTYADLRRQCMARLMDMPFDGYAVGGLAVGEPKSVLLDITSLCTDMLPKNKPRYLMGVGKPEDLVDAIALGVDLFDCVIPTRNARNGTVYTRRGKLIVKNHVHQDDFSPIDASCSCYTCRHFTRAYLRHLFQAGEILGPRLTTLHNIRFFMELVEEARKAVLENRFPLWKNEFFNVYYNQNDPMQQGG